MNHGQRRPLLARNHVKGTPGRAPRRTGQPEWFVAMKWEAERKRLFSKLPTAELTKYGVTSLRQQKALEEAGFKNVWAIVDASYSDLRAVTGFGPKTLAKLRQDFQIKAQVKVNWSIPDGR